MGDRGADDHELAARLSEARRRLGEIRLPAAETERLRRRFFAVCDAIKAREADVATGLRRLAAFLDTLEQAVANRRGNKSQKERTRS
jgi:uncharacterized protein with gpF-like domain